MHLLYFGGAYCFAWHCVSFLPNALLNFVIFLPKPLQLLAAGGENVLGDRQFGGANLAAAAVRFSWNFAYTSLVSLRDCFSDDLISEALYDLQGFAGSVVLSKIDRKPTYATKH